MYGDCFHGDKIPRIVWTLAAETAQPWKNFYGAVEVLGRGVQLRNYRRHGQSPMSDPKTTLAAGKSLLGLGSVYIPDTANFISSRSSLRSEVRLTEGQTWPVVRLV